MATSFDSSLTIRNCTIENNTATSNSGAIDCYSGCTLTVENSMLRNNQGLAAGAGAAVVHTDCAATFTNCAITGNTCAGAGGAVWVDHSTAAFTGCTIENNTAADGGGGLAAYNGSVVTVDASTIRHNTARWGGGVTSNDSTLTIRRTTLETNQATQYSGGAIDLYNNQTTIVNAALRANTAADGGAGISLGQNSTLTAANCTIYANSAVNSGGGIGMYQATLALNNSILYANTATNTPGLLDKQLTVFSGTRTVNRSCVQGLSGQLGGSGNIGGNPLLVDPSAGNLTLGSGSPCIDAASNALVPAGVTLDLAGNPRFADDPSVADTGVGPAPIVDMGAFERAGPPPCAADIGVQGGLPGHDGHLDNNDFIAFISFFFALDSRADLGIQGGLPGHDGHFDNNDFIAFINLFFSGCS
ncbi:MAG: GC-type dockerin domain-anchored protein [Phycisphaerales bacterium]